MASNQTPNYGLNQWAATDRVIRTEFNADNEKIDAALATIPKIVTGVYTGDGAEEQFISLDFTPRAVFVCRIDGAIYSVNGALYHYGGLALTGNPAKTCSNDAYLDLIQIESGGFRVYYYYSNPLFNNVHANTNESDTTYHYIALA